MTQERFFFFFFFLLGSAYQSRAGLEGVAGE